MENLHGSPKNLQRSPSIARVALSPAMLPNFLKAAAAMPGEGGPTDCVRPDEPAR